MRATVSPDVVDISVYVTKKLVEAGIMVHATVSHTPTVYLRLDGGKLYSMRISDHPRNEGYSRDRFQILVDSRTGTFEWAYNKNRGCERLPLNITSLNEVIAYICNFRRWSIKVAGGIKEYRDGIHANVTKYNLITVGGR